MKTINIVSIVLAILFQLCVQHVFAQCKGFEKQVDFSLLNEYNYCGNVMGATMYSKDSAEVELKVEPRKKYRILLKAQEYLGQARLEVVNRSNEVISLELESDGKAFWEVYTESKQTVLMKIYFEKRSKHNHGIDAAGCVLLAVGQVGLEELVDKP